MKPHNRHMAFATGIALTLLLLLIAGPLRSQPSDQAEATIQYLLDYVSSSNLTFVRNTSEYTPGEAAEHMTKKYRHFMDDIATPEDFIALCATKSLMSGKPYLVVDSEGKELRSGDWLTAALTAYRGDSR